MTLWYANKAINIIRARNLSTEHSNSLYFLSIWIKIPNKYNKIPPVSLKVGETPHEISTLETVVQTNICESCLQFQAKPLNLYPQLKPNYVSNYKLVWASRKNKVYFGQKWSNLYRKFQTKNRCSKTIVHPSTSNQNE